MRISELVKTYRWLNDPSAPAWNVRFVGALALFALVAAGVGGLYWMTRVDPPAEQAAGTALSSEEPSSSPVLMEYVGLPPSPAILDSAPARAALEAWKAQHPGATLLEEVPVHAPSGAIAGYQVVYLA